MDVYKQVVESLERGGSFVFLGRYGESSFFGGVGRLSFEDRGHAFHFVRGERNVVGVCPKYVEYGKQGRNFLIDEDLAYEAVVSGLRPNDKLTPTIICGNGKDHMDLLLKEFFTSPFLVDGRNVNFDDSLRGKVGRDVESRVMGYMLFNWASKPEDHLKIARFFYSVPGLYEEDFMKRVDVSNDIGKVHFMTSRGLVDEVGDIDFGGVASADLGNLGDRLPIREIGRNFIMALSPRTSTLDITVSDFQFHKGGWGNPRNRWENSIFIDKI